MSVPTQPTSQELHRNGEQYVEQQILQATAQQQCTVSYAGFWGMCEHTETLSEAVNHFLHVLVCPRYSDYHGL